MALPSSPNNRKEVYLSNIAGQGTSLPSEPITREEEYLDFIAKNGGGGGGTGDGDMKKSIYDSDLAVASAGGIGAYVASAISGKVDAVVGKGLSTNDYDNTAKGIVDGVNSALGDKVSKSNTAGLLKNDGTVDQTSYATAASVTAIKDGTTIDSFGDVETALSNKVDKVNGKGLSTNDYDASAKSKLDNLANIKSISTGLNLDASGALTATGAEITIDSNPTQGSTNPVSSGGVYTALAGKQATLTFDDRPTASSTNPVTSGGVRTAIDSVWTVVGPIESGLTSAHAYEVGDHLNCWIGFAEVIAPIAVGDELVRNVNVVEGTVAKAVSNNLRGINANTKLIKDTVGWSGKNKAKNIAPSRTVNNATFTVASDRKITVNTSQAVSTDVGFYFGIANGEPVSFPISDLENGMKFLGATNNNSNVALRIIYRNAQDGFISYQEQKKDPIAVQIPANAVYYRMCIQLVNGATADNVVFAPLLVDKDCLDLSYEPYRGTTAFPRDEQAVLGATNLLDVDANTSSQFEKNASGQMTNHTSDTVSTLDFAIQGRKNGSFVKYLVGTQSGHNYITSTGKYEFAFTIEDSDDINQLYIGHKGNTNNVMMVIPFTRKGTFYFSANFVGVNPSTQNGYTMANNMVALSSNAPYADFAMTNRELTENKQDVLTAGTNIAISSANVISTTSTYTMRYSTSEQVVGTWIDNKPLYQKTFSGTTSSTGSGIILTPSMPNIDKILYVDGFIYIDNSGTNHQCIPIGIQWTDSNGTGILFTIRTNDFDIVVNATHDSWKNKPIYITLQYTKTTD